MSEFQPPTPEEIAALTPDRLRSMLAEIEATTYPKEVEDAIRIAIAGMRRLVEVRERLAHPDASIDDILAILRRRKP